MTKIKYDTSAGFSLAELVIVVACAIVLLGAAVPNLVHLRNQWILWGEVKSIEVSLQWGRMHAISANTAMLFEIDDNRQKYCWIDPISGDPYKNTLRQLPAGIMITACPRRPLRFYQHGNAAPAGTYTITGDAGSYSVVVSPGGRIRFQKN